MVGDNKKKEKAFTLIELLAVIVILAVIALIATPIILNIIEKSRKSAFLDSVYGIEKSANAAFMESILNGQPSTEKTYVFNGNKPEGLNYSGTSPKGGSLIVREDGTILLALHNGTWCAKKGMGDKKITITRYESGKCVILENAKDPVIALKGEATITLKVGESYTEPGVEAKTIDGSELTYIVEIKKDDEIVNSIDTSKAGRYVITYKAESHGKISAITRVIIIKMVAINGNELAAKDNLEELAGMKRYRGENPNNWICFGDSSITKPTECDENHKWRIIGIDNEGRMKIMTNYYYSESKVWDTSDSNNWGRPATLKTELEGSSFYSNNSYIDETHREYIVDATWYTGGNKTNNGLLQDFVNGEKDNSTTGYVGLMSMTDYGYASNSCTLTTIVVVSNNECISNNWIEDAKYQWSITPWSGDTYDVGVVHKYGNVTTGHAMGSSGVRPSVYIDANVKIIEGKGTEAEPYILTK